MQSIRKKILMFILFSALSSLILSALFVNITINNTFKRYMEGVQQKRDTRIVQYFQQVYKRDGKWKSNSGEELMHEAYMSNYCITLMDKNKDVIWSMNPYKIQATMHMENMMGSNKGIYTTKTYEIKNEDKIVGYVSLGQYSSLLLSEEDVKFKSEINKSILLSIIFTILITIIISVYLSKEFSRPIKKVSDVSVELSKGNYNVNYNGHSNIVEIRNLEDSINDLREKLKKQEVLRKRLVSDISHEIRTPLNVLQNNLEAMVDGIFPINNENLNSLNDEVIRFGKLLDNLNVLKGFEEEGLALNMEKISLNGVIASVINDFTVTVEDKGLKIYFNEGNGKNYYILGDENKLKQVFINLISNSMKFAKDGGSIWVNIKENKKHIIVEVIDNGIGIKKEDLPFIFERLYRGDKSRHEREGSGIGLTIVKKIITLHSASINVESQWERGTKIIIIFKKLN
ncbi:HAMP domain-containing sensor histidine kinase [Clostridium lundense]|uniref:HAMP domain-containing sensor histidine kinase n=1 Tax=Clostridium lundense TaxID=319475 RepID=UPI000482F5A3|nr:HAMP domain-containing sensor histidine kinase [Clostridium lundense]